MRVAFLPRHGLKHQLPPHRINYRANLWAMKELGVTRIIGPCAAGSLKTDVKPGDFVVSDQLVDRTSGARTPSTTARRRLTSRSPIRTAPSCAALAIDGPASTRASPFTSSGTVVTIQGPRFSTRSESKWFQDAGWEVINMTQYPEAYLARELEICYVERRADHRLRRRRRRRGRCGHPRGRHRGLHRQQRQAA